MLMSSRRCLISERFMYATPFTLDGRAHGDLHEQYKTVRGDLHLARTQLLNISVPTGTQPCEVFGVHPKLPFLRSLYQSGDAAFVANVGALAEPITKTEYKEKSKWQILRPYALGPMDRVRMDYLLHIYWLSVRL